MAKKRTPRVKCSCGAEVTAKGQFDHWLKCGNTLFVPNSDQDSRYGRTRRTKKRGGAPRGGKVYA